MQLVVRIFFHRIVQIMSPNFWGKRSPKNMFFLPAIGKYWSISSPSKSYCDLVGDGGTGDPPTRSTHFGPRAFPRVISASILGFFLSQQMHGQNELL